LSFYEIPWQKYLEIFALNKYCKVKFLLNRHGVNKKGDGFFVRYVSKRDSSPAGSRRGVKLKENVPEGCLITGVEKGGVGETAGLCVGDFLLSLNGNPIRDKLDFLFYATDCLRCIKFLHAGKSRAVRLRQPMEVRLGLGITLDDMRTRACGNRCIFCFVDQLPPHLRHSLYFKDEDFRFSFLYGNYITATNLSEADIRRIVTQRIFPLYISVHATNPKVRRGLLGNPDAPDIIPILKRLAEGGVRFHTQIVLMPGLNDGAILEETLNALDSLYPSLLSIAIVPVGLTIHRRGLPRLCPVTSNYAKKLIPYINKRRCILRKRHGENFLFLSDEFYLLAGRKPPAYGEFDEIPQLENGVGMVAEFYRRFNAAVRWLPRRINPSRRIAIITARLGALALNRLCNRLNKVKGLHVRKVVVKNNLFGRQVTVSGLLAGRDIASAIRAHPNYELYLLPSNCLNTDGFFLDDMTPAQVEKETGAHIIIVPPSSVEIIKCLLRYTSAS